MNPSAGTIEASILKNNTKQNKGRQQPTRKQKHELSYNYVFGSVRERKVLEIVQSRKVSIVAVFGTSGKRNRKQYS